MIDESDPIFSGCSVRSRLVQHLKVSGPTSRVGDLVAALRKYGYSIYGPFAASSGVEVDRGTFVLEAQEPTKP